jgi:hypothetical protein
MLSKNCDGLFLNDRNLSHFLSPCSPGQEAACLHHRQQILGGIGRSRLGHQWSGRGIRGARPQTAEIVKTFNERCEACIVTMKL